MFCRRPIHKIMDNGLVIFVETEVQRGKKGLPYKKHSCFT